MPDDRIQNVERVTFTQIIAALKELDAIGENELQADAKAKAEAFFTGLVASRHSRVRSRRRQAGCPMSADDLVERLFHAATAYHQAEPGILDTDTLTRLGSECSRLAASIQAAAVEAPASLSVLVQIDVDGRGYGELVLLRLTPEVGETQRDERWGEP